MAREQFTFCHTLRVRWAEVDKQGVVFNGNYFLYFDVAVTEYWRTIGINYPDDWVKTYATDMYAVRAAADYHGSAEFDDLLDIHARTARLGRSSIQFLLEIWRADARLVSGELIYVNADLASKKSAVLPEALRQKMISYERVAPDIGPAKS